MIKVSIILPTYNSEKIIQRTLDSILQQQGMGETFDIELLIVDDCSTDNTLKILQRNKVSWLSTGENSGGANKGRNMGLRLATGDYICFIDHDDTWMPDKLLKQLAMIQDYEIVGTGIKLINSKGITIKCLDNEKWFLNNLCMNGRGMSFNSIMIKAEFKTEKFEEIFGMFDDDYMLRILRFHSAYNIPEVLVNKYVMESSNLSRTDYCNIAFYYHRMYDLENYDMYLRQVRQARKRLNSRFGKFWYKKGKMRKARRYLLKAGFSKKHLILFITSFIWHKLIKRYINFLKI